MAPNSGVASQQDWPIFHAYGNFLLNLVGAEVATINIANPSLLLLDSIDLVNTGPVENQQAALSIGAADGSTDRITFLQAFVYAQSQGTFPWRGQILLAGDGALWIASNGGQWQVNWHGLILPSYAGQQFDQA